jgi:hypothetical protein
VGWFTSKKQPQAAVEQPEQDEDVTVIRMAPCRCKEWSFDCQCDQFGVTPYSREPSKLLLPKKRGSLKRTVVWLKPEHGEEVLLMGLDQVPVGYTSIPQNVRSKWPKVLGSSVQYQAWLHVGWEDFEDEPLDWSVRVNPTGRDEVLDLDEAQQA